MSNEDWYRRTTWTGKDREEFFARLKRSRGGFHKAQYARIQAWCLQELGTEEALKASLELLDMILTEWPQDAQLAAVYDQQATCLMGLGNLNGAVAVYRRVFETQRLCPGCLTMAHVQFAWLAATTPMPELFEEAVAVLREFGALDFPVARYRAYAACALIWENRGQLEKARSYARDALREAAATHSGFRYHAKLGLVQSPDEAVHARIEQLAH
jgi:tetratricopeptide (TPR) repeat protein